LTVLFIDLTVNIRLFNANKSVSGNVANESVTVVPAVGNSPNAAVSARVSV
jgi:hypothetical protein